MKMRMKGSHTHRDLMKLPFDQRQLALTASLAYFSHYRPINIVNTVFYFRLNHVLPADQNFADDLDYREHLLRSSFHGRSHMPSSTTIVTSSIVLLGWDREQFLNSSATLSTSPSLCDNTGIIMRSEIGITFGYIRLTMVWIYGGTACCGLRWASFNTDDFSYWRR